MLSKNRRLTRQQFWNVYKTGAKVQRSEFSAIYLANKIGYSRFAVVTSAKLAKKAVIRNRLRRKIYNILRLGDWRRGFDVVIIPQPGVLNLRDEQISFELDQVLSKIH